MVREATIMEKHFLNWYNKNKNSLFKKIHKVIRPNCKWCKVDDDTYKQINDALNVESEVKDGS